MQVQSARLTDAQQALAASALELQALQKLHNGIHVQLRAAMEEASTFRSQAEAQAADLAVLQRVHDIVKVELEDSKASKSPRKGCCGVTCSA